MMMAALFSPKDSSVALSPFSSPNIRVLLKIKTISWSQETGLPVSVHIRVGGRTFNLHKHPLVSKSGYFNKRLAESNELELPPEFPGGQDTFEMIALFIYGSSTLVDPFNVAALRCAAEFLEMTEDYLPGKLCDRFDLYLNQVVLQRWDDTLIVLQKCRSLLPLSEDLLIVSRCIESLAFMACMEIIDPERRQDQPVVTVDALTSQGWTGVGLDLWIKDLIAIPFAFFERVIGSLRRQGMKEKYVSPIIVFYGNKRVLSEKDLEEDDSKKKQVIVILQGVLDLLPLGQKTGRVIPVGFYFALLSKSLELGLKGERLSKLEEQIASVLHFAQSQDFLQPKTGQPNSISSSIELATMEKILTTNMKTNNHNSIASNSVIAELWDEYLTYIVSDPKMGPARFMELIEIVPISFRENHDRLYEAMNKFLQTHSNLSQYEKGAVCRYLNCQKLSQEACIEAVQNELMPLRLIVQALFVQQMNTHQAFKECSGSFRYANCIGEYSGSITSSRCPNSKSEDLGETETSLYTTTTDGADIGNRTLSFLMQKDVVIPRQEFSRKEYESTSFRIQNLEQELVSLKKSLQWQNVPKKREAGPVLSELGRDMKVFGLEEESWSRKRKPIGEVTGCIGAVNFDSQRKYASRLLKLFRQIMLFGRRKQKRKSERKSI